MNETFKTHIISSGRVFLSTFIVMMAGTIASAGTITWTKEFWIPVLVGAVSGGLKAIFKI